MSIRSKRARHPTPPTMDSLLHQAKRECLLAEAEVTPVLRGSCNTNKFFRLMSEDGLYLISSAMTVLLISTSSLQSEDENSAHPPAIVIGQQL